MSKPHFSICPHCWRPFVTWGCIRWAFTWSTCKPCTERAWDAWAYRRFKK